MATSGSVDFSRTRNEIIQHAYNLLGVYGIGRTVSNEDMSLASNALNMQIKSWQAQGIHIWAQEEAVLFLQDETGTYTLGNSSSYITSEDDAVVTELTADAATSATTLYVDSTSGMAVSDIVGIVLDDDTTHWTTVATVASSTSITIASGLASAASDNNNVYAFTSRINKPLRIHSIRRVSGVGTSQTEVPMVALSHEDFHNLPTKKSVGVPSHYYYNPDLSTGKLKIWPLPNDPELRLHITYERMLEDVDSANDEVDFPVEWLEVMAYQLAVRLAPAFGREDKLDALASMASIMLKQKLDWDTEITSMTIMPDIRG